MARTNLYVVLIFIVAVCRRNVHSIKSCDEHEFGCKDGACINEEQFCDSNRDCEDNSDEENCLSKCTLNQRKFLCKDNETCINLNKVCNYYDDCPDASDENGMCEDYEENCDSKMCPGDSECQDLPTGAECLCSKGYKYNGESNMCEDIINCETFGVCSQGCINTYDSYQCTCSENYELMADNKTCVVKFGEPLLVYSTNKTVVGIFLKSKHAYTVADNLTLVIGVANDGHNIYWTSITEEAECICKALENGSKEEILLSSGLDTPEDLAVDWLTGNIYFSDSGLRHIAVCTSSGHYCTPLVVIDVDKPRGIALWPQMGLMYWTDWGISPMIGRASMDGVDPVALVKTNIDWPNGVTLDTHNERLYWVDAKLLTIESIRMDGSDRRLILSDILKHPYGIALFEDNLYWSDWGTRSVHTCHKFTGKGHEEIVNDSTIYAVHVYHSANQPKVKHACEDRKCTHLCLLAAKNSSTCACPVGMFLAIDQTRCVKLINQQILYIGVKNIILEMEHTTFGKHKVLQEYTLPILIHQMAYNSINETILIADNIQKVIAEYDPNEKHIKTLVRGSLGNVTALAFDYLAQNLYWTDSERHVVEVYSLRMKQRAIINSFAGGVAPIGIGLLPEDGKMFIALRSSKDIHIDQKTLSGNGDHTHVFENIEGMGAVQIVPDHEIRTLYWVDTDAGRIEFSMFDDLHEYPFRTRLVQPASMALVDDDVFWTTLNSPYIFWTHKSNLGSVKKTQIDISNLKVVNKMQLLSSRQQVALDHPCLHNNGGCSHLCVASGNNSAICLCPSGLVFQDARNETCVESSDCEFRCKSGECLTSKKQCNGLKECLDGSDKDLCDPKARKTRNICAFNEFMCNGSTQCISNDLVCNQIKECRDGSDEEHCETFVVNDCPKGTHKCEPGRCIEEQFVCDGNNDCGDSSDELSCAGNKRKIVCGDEDAEFGSFTKSKKFQCPSEPTICLDWKAKCNGTSECPQGEDEIGCHGGNVSVYTYIYVFQTINR